MLFLRKYSIYENNENFCENYRESFRENAKVVSFSQQNITLLGKLLGFLQKKIKKIRVSNHLPQETVKSR
jgi:hypothetical protein